MKNGKRNLYMQYLLGKAGCNSIKHARGLIRACTLWCHYQFVPTNHSVRLLELNTKQQQQKKPIFSKQTITQDLHDDDVTYHSFVAPLQSSSLAIPLSCMHSQNYFFGNQKKPSIDQSCFSTLMNLTLSICFISNSCRNWLR